MSNWPIEGTALVDVSLSDTATSQSATTFSTGINGDAPTWVEILAAIPYDCDAITVRCQSTDSYSVFDLATGTIGSEVAVVPDILYQCRDSHMQQYTFPLALAQGQRLAVACTVPGATAGTAWAWVMLHRRTGLNPRGADRIVAVNASRATGRATNISSAAASSNTKGSWLELAASLPCDLTRVVAHFGIGSATSLTTSNSTNLVDFAVGPSGGEEVVLSNVLARRVGGSSTLVETRVEYAPSFLPIRAQAGDRLTYRHQSTQTGAVSRTIGVALYVAA